MKENKFKGQLFSGKWVYGFYAKLPRGEIMKDHIYDGEWHEVKSGTVVQYTSLCDKNGNAVYDRDTLLRILSYSGREEITKVVFNNGCFYQVFENGTRAYLFRNIQFCEVIENKEDS